MPDLPPPSIELTQPATARFDLAEIATPASGRDFHAIKPRCGAPRTGEIVVCAPDPEKQRLRPLPALPGQQPPGEIALSDSVNLGAHVESTMIGGAPSNRVMVDVKLKF